MDKNLATLEIRFENCSLSEAQTKAKDLRDYMMDASRDAKVDIVKDSQATMDLGATLILVLGTPAIVAVAKGISAYLTRAGGTVTITPDGGVETKGIAGDDVAKIVAALSKRK